MTIPQILSYSLHFVVGGASATEEWMSGIFTTPTQTNGHTSMGVCILPYLPLFGGWDSITRTLQDAAKGPGNANAKVARRGLNHTLESSYHTSHILALSAIAREEVGHHKTALSMLRAAIASGRSNIGVQILDDCRRALATATAAKKLVLRAAGALTKRAPATTT